MSAARILVVEDESIIALTIEQTLNDLGFEFAGTARTGEQAIEMAGQIRPDLVLMDIRLAGEMDGVEAAAQIRAKLQLPVVYLTSHGDDAILARARMTEPFGYILKPFEDRDIQIAVEMALYKHRAEIQIRRLQKMEAFAQLSGGIAQHFNNLLTVIHGYAGMIKDRSGSDPNILSFVGQVQAAADRATNLTHHLLTFSQRQMMERRALDLNRVVHGTLDVLRRTLPPWIIVDFEPAGALCIEADENMIEQLVVNLVLNACDAMPGGGRLAIETREVEITPKDLERSREAAAGRFARLTVSDTGCGMSRETLSRVFEPFFTTKDTDSGTGMGLSAVHGIVKQHHGWIEVASEIGAGTRFDIFLALVPCEIPTPKAPLADTLPTGRETILLVDDEPLLRQLVRLSLESGGYRVIEAETGRKAIDLWPRCADEVSLVLADMVMPDGLSGRELAEWLIEKNPEIKIILSSGFTASAADREFVSRAGGTFLQKPYLRAQLLQTVRECLDR